MKKNKLTSVCFSVFFIECCVNLLGALGPELAFDPLWYHLTLPKLYLIQHTVTFIPGGLLYYSAMPKLGEMLYVGGLSFGSEIIPKVIQYTFGILIAIIIYKIARKYFSLTVAVLCMLVFYGNLVVAWESTTAYIDLIRTFFEISALWSLLIYFKKRTIKWLLTTAILLGCAITTKLIAIGSIGIFIVLLLYDSGKNRQKIITTWRNILIFFFITLSVPLPWFLFSYIHTKNPVYPLFSSLYPLGNTIWFHPLGNTWQLLTHADDPLSPVYIAFLPLLIYYLLFRKRIKYKEKNQIPIVAILLYSLFALLIWNITPQTGGGRFMLPYLPGLTLVTGFILYATAEKYIQFLLTGTILLTSIITIFYRGIANTKFIPVVFGMESKDAFLSHHLNYSFGDFYDIDNYFKKTIHTNDKVLLYGFHNLFYIDFPFVDSSWIQNGDRFNYIAVQNGTIPKKFAIMKQVYENTMTQVKLYERADKSWVIY